MKAPSQFHNPWTTKNVSQVNNPQMKTHSQVNNPSTIKPVSQVNSPQLKTLLQVNNPQLKAISHFLNSVGQTPYQLLRWLTLFLVQVLRSPCRTLPFLGFFFSWACEAFGAAFAFASSLWSWQQALTLPQPGQANLPASRFALRPTFAAFFFFFHGRLKRWNPLGLKLCPPPPPRRHTWTRLIETHELTHRQYPPSELMRTQAGVVKPICSSPTLKGEDSQSEVCGGICFFQVEFEGELSQPTVVKPNCCRLTPKAKTLKVKMLLMYLLLLSTEQGDQVKSPRSKL